MFLERRYPSGSNHYVPCDVTLTLHAPYLGVLFCVLQLGGAVFPPAGAVAVLLVDNAALKGSLGKFYDAAHLH